MIELARFPVQDILPRIGLNFPRIQLAGHSVKAGSHRLECLKRSQKCVSCRRWKVFGEVWLSHDASSIRQGSGSEDLFQYLREDVSREQMIFYTQSGSAYELDRDGSRVRRLAGEDNPTPRQGKDGEWRVFDSCSDVVVGIPVLINWEEVKCTVTSPVKMILPEGPAN